MKSLILLTLAAAALACIPPAVAAEEDVYWDINETGSTTITHKSETSSKSSQPKDAKSLSDKEVYDSGEPARPGDADREEEAAPPAVRRPMQSAPSVDRSAPAATQRRPQVRQRRNTSPAGSEETGVRDAVKKPDTKRVGPSAEPSVTVDKSKADQPKPSQVEAEPAEPKAKLPWGKDK
jgi:hypothetical protein